MRTKLFVGLIFFSLRPPTTMLPANADGFSARATQNFMRDLLANARRHPPKNGKIKDPMNTMAKVTTGAGGDGETVVVSALGCMSRVRQLESNPAMVVALSRIFSDISAGGATLEVVEKTSSVGGGVALHERLDEETRISIGEQLVNTAEEMFKHYIANGFAVLVVEKDAEDTSVSVPRVMEPNEYLLRFSQKNGQTRKYEVYSLRQQKVLRDAHVAILRAPDNFGATRGPLSTMRKLAGISDSLMEDRSHSSFWRANRVPTTEAYAGSSVNKPSEVTMTSHFVTADNQEEVEEKRSIILDRHRSEQEDAVVEVEDELAAQALDMLSKMSGPLGTIDDTYNPALEAIAHPPHARMVRLGLDRRMGPPMPVPEIDPSLIQIVEYINNLTFALFGAPPTMGTDAVQRTAEEMSMKWRYYTNAVHGLQEQMANNLALVWRNIGREAFRQMFLDEFDVQNPPPSETDDQDDDDDVATVSRRATRSLQIDKRIESLSVHIRFNHVPTINPQGIKELRDEAVISEDTAANYLAAYYGVQKSDQLSPEERKQALKRRFDEELDRARKTAAIENGQKSLTQSSSRPNNSPSSGSAMTK